MRTRGPEQIRIIAEQRNEIERLQAQLALAETIIRELRASLTEIARLLNEDT